ncbi:NfeD family protein [bacterium]|nr:NfeD family protein [bacterium]
MEWWIWAVLGLVFLIGEILTPGGVFIIFFAVGAFLLAILELAGVQPTFWLQLVLFAATSVSFLLVFRRPILRYLDSRKPDHEVDALIGEEVMPIDSIPAGTTGQVELRGTTWKAVNVGVDLIGQEDICVVTRVNGLRFDIEKKK